MIAASRLSSKSRPLQAAIRRRTSSSVTTSGDVGTCGGRIRAIGFASSSPSAFSYSKNVWSAWKRTEAVAGLNRDRRSVMNASTSSRRMAATAAARLFGDEEFPKAVYRLQVGSDRPCGLAVGHEGTPHALGHGADGGPLRCGCSVRSPGRARR